MSEGPSLTCVVWPDVLDLDGRKGKFEIMGPMDRFSNPPDFFMKMHHSASPSQPVRVPPEFEAEAHAQSQQQHLQHRAFRQFKEVYWNSVVQKNAVKLSRLPPARLQLGPPEDPPILPPQRSSFSVASEDLSASQSRTGPVAFPPGVFELELLEKVSQVQGHRDRQSAPPLEHISVCFEIMDMLLKEEPRVFHNSVAVDSLKVVKVPPPPCACTALSKHGVGVEPPF